MRMLSRPRARRSDRVFDGLVRRDNGEGMTFPEGGSDCDQKPCPTAYMAATSGSM
jgi:hypothetical protein